MLRFAILELLQHRPLSGYQLKRRFGGSIVFFWTASHSQIYPELKRMQRDGLVVGRKIAQQSRPAKTVYAVTSKGQRTLVEWLRQKPPLPPVKDVMLLKTFAFNLLSAEEASAQLRHHEKLRRQRLELYLDIKRQLNRRHGDLLATDDPILFWNGLCLQHEIAYERMYVAWCKWALARCRDFHRRRSNGDVRRELAQ